MGFMDETVASVLAGNHPHDPSPPFYVGGERQKPNFIPVDITEDVIKSVAQKILGSSGPGGTDSEYLQGWLLKFGQDSKKLRTSVKFFFTG